MTRRVFLLIASVATMAGWAAASQAQDVTVRVDTAHATTPVPADFAGLSYETQVMLPEADRGHYFDRRRRSLVAMFRTLGVRSLRIGGNSVDAKASPLPSLADVDSLFDFARDAGAKIIYSVRLHDGDPASAADYARHIAARYPDVTGSFSIGNEPYYYGDYAVYATRWSAIAAAMRGAFPAARFSGPDQNPKPDLFRKVAAGDALPKGAIAQINIHSYAGGCAYANCSVKDIDKLVPRDPAILRGLMLSGEMEGEYETIRQGLTKAIAGTGLPFRLSETNSFWYGGAKDASDSYAAALWGLDYMHWWAAHGAAGVNFHTGDRVGSPGGVKHVTTRYAVFLSDGDGYRAMPLAYGMKMFALGGEGGRVVPATLETKRQDIRVYAMLSPDRRLSVTIINRSHDAAAADARVRLVVPGTLKGVATIAMTAPANAVSVKDGIRIGGAAITARGDWSGRWQVGRVSPDGSVTLTVPAASAVVVRAGLR